MINNVTKVVRTKAKIKGMYDCSYTGNCIVCFEMLAMIPAERSHPVSTANTKSLKRYG
jgi:hypothetical protein